MYQGRFSKSSRYCPSRDTFAHGGDFIMCSYCMIGAINIPYSVFYSALSVLLDIIEHKNIIRTNLLYRRVAFLSKSHHSDKCALLNRTMCSHHCRRSLECFPLDNMSHSSSHFWVWEASHKSPLRNNNTFKNMLLKTMFVK